MRRLALAFAPLCVSLALTACDTERPLREWQPSDHQPPAAVAPEGQAAGEDNAVFAASRAAQALWSSRCATCHGDTGRGDGPGKPPVAQVPDMTTAGFAKKYGDAELHAIIRDGRGMMPPFGAELTERGIEAMVGYVRTFAQPQ